MRKFDTSGFARLLHKIVDARDYALTMCTRGSRDEQVPPGGMSLHVVPVIEMTRDFAVVAELYSTLDRVDEGKGYFHQAASKEMTFQKLLSEIEFLRESIQADLEKRLFVFVPSEKAKALTEMPTLWEKIWVKIPDCKTDTEEAAYSYCLERNTASVFHSTRVSEYGLRNIARRVGVKLVANRRPLPIEFATWGTVLNAIKVRINLFHASPSGPVRNRNLQFYSEAADGCTFIRDIWRNDVAHARKCYDERDALTVLTRVREFMQLLVTGPN